MAGLAAAGLTENAREWSASGTLMPNGPSRNAPAPRSSSVPNTLGESKRGTHSQSGATSAPVWQSDT